MFSSSAVLRRWLSSAPRRVIALRRGPGAPTAAASHSPAAAAAAAPGAMRGLRVNGAREKRRKARAPPAAPATALPFLPGLADALFPRQLVAFRVDSANLGAARALDAALSLAHPRVAVARRLEHDAVGTEGVVVSHVLGNDGSCLVTVAGGRRFRIVGSPKMHEWGFPVGDVRPFGDRDARRREARALLERVREAYEDVIPDELAAALDEIVGGGGCDEPEAFSLFLARCLPMKSTERLRLLEMDSSIERLEALLDMRENMLVDN